VQAFSSLRIPHYKGFSRIHINAKVRSLVIAHQF